MANNFSFISFADFEYQFKILIQVFSNSKLLKFKIAFTNFEHFNLNIDEEKQEKTGFQIGHGNDENEK
jgi:hypothetical protein